MHFSLNPWDCEGNISLVLTLVDMFHLENENAWPANKDIGTGDPLIIKHSEWTNVPSNCTDTLDPPLSYIVIHHTAGNRCFKTEDCKRQLRNIQNYHMKFRQWCDIGYSFLIGEDGNIYEGRGWDKMGAHTFHYNHISYGIAFMGNFMNTSPNNLALNASKSLIAYAVSRKNLTPRYTLKGHRQFLKTACPGDTLYNIIKTWPGWKAT
uniref:Peptidoglycan-recognition protein n=1 Tax=Callorhinchus milii TaxID=7868 RepID=A0A4W3IYB8_CALMI